MPDPSTNPYIPPRPTIVWLPADPRNTRVRPTGIVYEAIVWHTTAGGTTIEDLGRWFGGENLRQGISGSTHFGVDRDGRVGQFVSLAAQPIAHGQEDGATAKLAKENTASANTWAIGIEHLDANVPGAVTKVQLEVSAALSAWLWATEILPHAARTGAFLDRDHFLGHYELAPASRARCPSWPEARFQDQITRVRDLLSPSVPPEPPVFDFRQHRNALLREQYERSLQDEIRAATRRAHDEQALIDAGLLLPEVRL